MSPIGWCWYAGYYPSPALLNIYGWGLLTQIVLNPSCGWLVILAIQSANFIAVLIVVENNPQLMMRLSNFITGPGGLSLYLITLASLTENVLARPSPEPKASWVRKGHGRKAISDVLKGKRDNLRWSVPSPSNITKSCVGTPAAQVSAPKVNVWAELEDTDAAAVVAWLFSQPEFNLTTTENATEWDNTV